VKSSEKTLDRHIMGKRKSVCAIRTENAVPVEERKEKEKHHVHPCLYLRVRNLIYQWL